MKKERLEALNDAVLAIIMTIMVLEIKTPDVPEFSKIIAQLPNFIAFVISSFFICTTWYNQNIVFDAVKKISKKIFAFDVLFLLCLSMFPLATAWIAEFPFNQTTEYFYFFVFFCWSTSYYLLDRALIKENITFFPTDYFREHTKAAKLHLGFEAGLFILGIILIHFIPIVGMSFSLLVALSWVIFNNHPEKKKANS